MKAIALLLLCAPLLAAEMEGDRIKLTPDEMRQCAEVERLQKSCRRLPHDV